MRRRDLFKLAGALAIGACDTGKPQQGVLGKMERVNRRVEGKLFSASRELHPGDITPEMAFPVYHVSPETSIAYGMNGHPLSPEHGAPVRLYGAVKLGYKQVKYLTEINFLDHETGGYWEGLGYEWYAGT